MKGGATCEATAGQGGAAAPLSLHENCSTKCLNEGWAAVRNFHDLDAQTQGKLANIDRKKMVSRLPLGCRSAQLTPRGRKTESDLTFMMRRRRFTTKMGFGILAMFRLVWINSKIGLQD